MLKNNKTPTAVAAIRVLNVFLNFVEKIALKFSTEGSAPVKSVTSDRNLQLVLYGSVYSRTLAECAD